MINISPSKIFTSGGYEGIKGNTHFLFADKNNLEVAGLLSKWLKEKGLDD
ncbi:MAG: hypothetical protein IJ587_02250 [Synergistaceae bacterium]|nr:hypothetical protein [Synergistaceae bacterium]